MRDLFEELWSAEYRICGDQEFAKAWARDILREHAHELAEKIRAAVEVNDDPNLSANGYGDYQNVLHAADLIDPKKEGQCP